MESVHSNNLTIQDQHIAFTNDRILQTLAITETRAL